MIGATLYMSCIDPQTKEIIGGVVCCSMCKRQVINAGITDVIVRETPTAFTHYRVRDWVINDDSLSDEFGY